MAVNYTRSRGTDPRAEVAELEHALQQIRVRIGASEAASVANWADVQYRQRRRRNAIFADDADLFGEPAWDILLDLLTAQKDGRAISISSACIAADVPPTTALRQLSRLQLRGLIERQSDTLDRRRHYLRLTDSALSKLLRVQESTS